MGLQEEEEEIMNFIEETNEIIFGKTYGDGSVRKAFRLYVDNWNIMQIEFYDAFGISYFADCEDLIAIMHEDLTGVTLKMIYNKLKGLEKA